MFSANRGIADLYAIKKHNKNYKKRRAMGVDPLVSSRANLECRDLIDSINIIDFSVAIEAKVRDWRKGLRQAMRYNAFSNLSYLALYEAHINAALAHKHIFQMLNIGLIGGTEEGIKVHVRPETVTNLNDDILLLASERVYSIIEDPQDGFVVGKNLFPHNSIARRLDTQSNLVC